MTAELQKILESKQNTRRELAAQRIAEKLRVLETMRDREIEIQNARLQRTDHWK
jgi:hypothetical protein